MMSANLCYTDECELVIIRLVLRVQSRSETQKSSQYVRSYSEDQSKRMHYGLDCIIRCPVGGRIWCRDLRSASVGSLAMATASL